jgi:mono/diheme cytochrome c family protein
MVRWIALGFLFFFVSLAGRAEDKKSERLWKAKCASCHGADGKAQTDQGKKMGVLDYSTATWQKAHADAELKQAIRAGVDKTQDGKKQQMDSYKDLSDDQVDGLVTYIRSFGR